MTIALCVSMLAVDVGVCSFHYQYPVNVTYNSNFSCRPSLEY